MFLNSSFSLGADQFLSCAGLLDSSSSGRSSICGDTEDTQGGPKLVAAASDTEWKDVNSHRVSRTKSDVGILLEKNLNKHWEVTNERIIKIHIIIIFRFTFIWVSSAKNCALKCWITDLKYLINIIMVLKRSLVVYNDRFSLRWQMVVDSYDLRATITKRFNYITETILSKSWKIHLAWWLIEANTMEASIWLKKLICLSITAVIIIFQNPIAHWE